MLYTSHHWFWIDNIIPQNYNYDDDYDNNHQVQLQLQLQFVINP